MSEFIVIHGHPGASKTRQSKDFANKGGVLFGYRNITHLSIGDHIRSIRNGESDSIYSDFLSLDLPTDRVVNDIVFEAIKLVRGNDIVLLDGYPRYPNGTKHFFDTITRNKQLFLGTIALEIPLEESIRRTNNRGIRVGERANRDTLEDCTRSKYKEYESSTRAAIALLARRGPVKTIDASGSLEEVAGLALR